MHWNIHVQDHLRVIFRESSCERYYETNVAAKAKTARAKESRKPSRKRMRTRTKSLPGFRRCSLDLEKHGPSLKNALVGAASFYKSMLDNALLRNADRGLSHFKDTVRPYFVKGVNHVFLWRFLQLLRTHRGQHEFVHWICRFEIAQTRLLASRADLIDLTDLPEVGTPEFMAALTEEQRQQFNVLQADEERATYQVTLREQTIANRRIQH